MMKRSGIKIGVYGDVPQSVVSHLATYGTIESINQQTLCDYYDLVVVEVSSRDESCRGIVDALQDHDGDVWYLCHRDALTDEHTSLNTGPWFVVYHETDPNPLPDRIDALNYTHSDTKTISIYGYDGQLWYEVESRTVEHRLAIVEPVRPIDVAASDEEIGAYALVSLAHVRHDLPADTDRRDNIQRYVIEPMGCESRENLVRHIPGCAVQTTDDPDTISVAPYFSIPHDGLQADDSRAVILEIDDCAGIGRAIVQALQR